MLEKPKDDLQKQFNMFVSGLAFGDMQEISEQEENSIALNEQDNQGPEMDSSSDAEEI